MRSAVILGVWPELANVFEGALFDGWRDKYGVVEDGDIAGGDIFGFEPRINKGYDWMLCVARRYVLPHTDEVLNDHTVGVIIEGDHTLFTGNGRPVANRLERGSVFVLNNKKLHGVKGGTKKLVFATHDFDADSMNTAVDLVRNWLSSATT